uniref:Uncharacterized protein n=1 Tax=Anguilla anguilla TaxID=7936 RepID=A0A0E9RCU4_ANGAN
MGFSIGSLLQLLFNHFKMWNNSSLLCPFRSPGHL